MNFKNLIIIIMLGSLFFLIGCGQTQEVICNKPYILVGNDCCLDQNENKICDNDEIKKELQPKIEPNVYKNSEETNLEVQSTIDLITADASELALYSSEINAGYSLNLQNSGVYQYDLRELPELKSTSLTRTFVTSYTKPGTETHGTRYLTFYTRTFETIEGAEKGFDLIKENIKSDELYEEKNWGLLKVGEEKAIFLKKYLIEFRPYSRYNGLIKRDNVIMQVILTADGTEGLINEFSDYMEKLDSKAMSSDVVSSEVSSSSKSDFGLEKEGLIELKVNSKSRKDNIEMEGEYSYYSVNNLRETDHNYLILNLYLKNLKISDEYIVDKFTKKGYDTSYNNFLLKDENDNYYSANWLSFATGNNNADQILKKDSGFATSYFFEVLESAEEFTLMVYNKNVLIYEVQI
jgi:hypothetical protein